MASRKNTSVEKRLRNQDIHLCILYVLVIIISLAEMSR